MSVSTGRRTWEEASSPAAVRLAREYEQAWRDSGPRRHRPDLHEFLDTAGASVDGAGARLALLRADMTLRWEAGERVGAQWYLDRYADLSEDTIVALVYEEFCLREDDDEAPDPAAYLARFPQVAAALHRVLEIHELVGSGTPTSALSLSLAEKAAAYEGTAPFPEAGQEIAGFFLVEELGRGAFARVFLAREQQLACRPVALKVTRRGSREPQTLALLQHTHIVPVHSHQIDRSTGLHLLCMPYFGRTTLAQVLAECRGREPRSAAALVQALDRLEPAPGDAAPAGRLTGRAALARRSYDRAIAWWGARLAEALEHAHVRGVLHRDIKPSNVLVTADGLPMLLDFNLAHEPLTEASPAGDGSTLGGTLDYMAPEHLRALAENAPKQVDRRSDLYSLGVVLYEALTAERPFVAPRRGFSIAEALLSAADARNCGAPRVREIEPEVPPALEAVIRRCLQPEPEDRYATAAELAADLQAVADDLPLPHTREPWLSRAGGWVRRNRRRLAAAGLLGLAGSTVLIAMLGFRLERADYARLIKKEYDQGSQSLILGEYGTAKKQLDATLDLLDHFDKMDVWRHAPTERSLPEVVRTLASKLRELHSGPDLDDIRANAQYKANLAERYDDARRTADTFFQDAERLRFLLLLGQGAELAAASDKLQQELNTYFVLTSRDWTKQENHKLEPLDPPRLQRLRGDVNELLFLWMLSVLRSLDEAPAADPGRRDAAMGFPQAEAAARAVAICDHALVFVEPKPPWRALKSRLQRHLRPAPPAAQGSGDFEGEPHQVATESSAYACFQWALLCLRSRRTTRAIEWMRRAVRLELDNYWYQYVLAYIEDQAGFDEDALNDYSVAAALKPNSPWVRHSRAKLYRARGKWSWAIDDMNSALEDLRGQPEARPVHLDLGYVYQELGDFPRARAEYDRVTATNARDRVARAARLNRANLDAESGSVDRARDEYDALLMLEPRDTAARLSRALLELRMGQAARAEQDLNALLDARLPQEYRLSSRSRIEVVSARALARLLTGRTAWALRDASEAREAHPCPAHERLWQRALLAAGRYQDLRVDRPEALARLPLGGGWLRADLRQAVDRLARRAAGPDLGAYRAGLSRAVLLAALGEHDAAVAAASGALALSPFSAEAYLIRARILACSGDRRRALHDVERGLAIAAEDPGLIDLRGVLRLAAGDPRGAIQDFNRAMAWGALDGVHAHKASALMALGEPSAAVQEWSMALRRDPELPESFLGRAQAHIRLQEWDPAMADLEQAATWAQSDPGIELAIAASYCLCLGERPDRLPRFLTLARRTVVDLGRLLEGHSRALAGAQ
ncbi:MAG TPA: protein kinase [Isosphaeraceae bacterium]|nr:protein kinase [Isosphaeraceae bacterium]